MYENIRLRAMKNFNYYGSTLYITFLNTNYQKTFLDKFITSLIVNAFSSFNASSKEKN